MLSEIWDWISSKVALAFHRAKPIIDEIVADEKAIFLHDSAQAEQLVIEGLTQGTSIVTIILNVFLVLKDEIIAQEIKIGEEALMHIATNIVANVKSVFTVPETRNDLETTLAGGKI